MLNFAPFAAGVWGDTDVLFVHCRTLNSICPSHFLCSLPFHSTLSSTALTPSSFSSSALALPVAVSSLALLILRHVWLGLFPPAPHNKTMTLSLLSLKLPDSQSLYFFSHSILLSFSVTVCLSVCTPSLPLSPYLSPLWWPGEYVCLESICPADKDVSGDGCSGRRRAAGPCQCWSVLGNGSRVSQISPGLAWLLH